MLPITRMLALAEALGVSTLTLLAFRGAARGDGLPLFVLRRLLVDPSTGRRSRRSRSWSRWRS
jgi:hypothetical protein